MVRTISNKSDKQPNRYKKQYLQLNLLTSSGVYVINFKLGKFFKIPKTLLPLSVT